MKIVLRVLDVIVDATTILGGLSIVAMMFHIVVDVALRYLFASPLPGTMSIVSHYYMVIVAFIPLAYAEKLDAHISVEVFYAVMPTWMKRVSIVITSILAAFILAIMMLKSWDLAVEKYHLGVKVVQGGSVLPIWQGYFLVPLGLGLMIPIALSKAIRALNDEPWRSTEKASLHD